MMRKQFGTPTASHRPIGVLTCLAFGIVAMCGVRPASADDDDIVNADGFEQLRAAEWFQHDIFSANVWESRPARRTDQPGGRRPDHFAGPMVKDERRSIGTSTAAVQSTTFAPGGGNQAVQRGSGWYC